MQATGKGTDDLLNFTLKEQECFLDQKLSKKTNNS